MQLSLDTLQAEDIFSLYIRGLGVRPFLWTHHRDPMSAKPRGGGELLSNTQGNPASVVSSPHKSPLKPVLLHSFFVRASP